MSHDSSFCTPSIQVGDDAAAVLVGGVVSVDVLANDIGDGLQIVSFKSHSGSDIYQNADGELVYVADADRFEHLAAGKTMTDVVTYEVKDAQGHTAHGELKVTVTGADPATEIVGTRHGELLMGTDGADRIFARGGDDIVAAGAGDDLVYGGSGKDQLFGGDGADTIVGGGGADYLSGDYGNDLLIGGKGPDTYAFDDFWGNDVVVGFDPKKDIIQLPQVYFASLADVLAAARDDGHGNLVISTPSHAGEIDTITLMGVSAKSLRASDFVFI